MMKKKTKPDHSAWNSLLQFFFTFDPADVAIFNSASSGDFTPQFKIKWSSKLWFV